ncbi:MAG: ABC transporter permease subunit [Phycisphaerae bacterium]|jgi:ABC-type transport system involved in multi-copper enzyme maturation permease subunit
MTRFLAIAANTFIQTIRQPITVVLILVTFGVLVLSVPLAGWTMDPDANYRASDQKMLLDLGISTLLVSGLLMAAFSASAALSREIEDRTALTVISKPVSRATFVAGKFAGVAAAVAVAYYLATLVFLMTVRHGVMSNATNVLDWPVLVLGLSAFGAAILIAMLGNLLFGWTFTSAGVFASLLLLTLAAAVIGFVGKGWTIVPFGAEIPRQLPAGILMTFLSVMVFTAVAVAASTRLGQVMTLLICGGVLVVGYLHPYLFASEGTNPAVKVLGWLVPNLRLFDVQDALVREKAIPADYIVWATAYGALYIGGVLAVAAALFQRRSLEAATASASLPATVNLLAWAGRMAALAIVLWAVVTVMATAAFRTPEALVVRSAAVVVAAGAWILWTLFARGVKWSYGVLLAVSIVVAAAGLAAWLTYGQWPWLPIQRSQTALTAVLAAAVLLILLLPKTRHHFFTQSVAPR